VLLLVAADKKIIEDIITGSVEQKVLKILDKEPKTIDKLRRIINYEEVDLTEKLSLMELDRKIEVRDGRVFVS